MIGRHRIILIAAVDRNWAIGKDNKLLYNIPIDMKYFKDKTEGNIVVYGYNTLLSFSEQNILPNRDNIILTSKMIACGSDRMYAAHSVDEVIDTIKGFDDSRDVYICGGSSVYQQFIDMSDKACITIIDASTERADKFFPNLFENLQWKLIDYGSPIVDNNSGLRIQFHTFVKRKKFKNK